MDVWDAAPTTVRCHPLSRRDPGMIPGKGCTPGVGDLCPAVLSSSRPAALRTSRSVDRSSEVIAY